MKGLGIVGRMASFKASKFVFSALCKMEALADPEYFLSEATSKGAQSTCVTWDGFSELGVDLKLYASELAGRVPELFFLCPGVWDTRASCETKGILSTCESGGT